MSGLGYRPDSVFDLATQLYLHDQFWGVTKGRRTLGAKRANDIFQIFKKSVEE